MTTNKDTDLREALRRKYTNTPQLPSGFLNRMQQATQTKKHRASTLQTNPHSRRRTGWGWVGIAAAILIAILLWPESHRETMTQTQVIARQSVSRTSPQPVPQPVAEEKTENAMAEVQLAPQPARQPARKRRKAAVSTDDIQSAPVEEPMPTETEPTIQYQNIQTVHLSSDVVMHIIEASDMPAAPTVPSVSEIRARGLLLTDNVRQASQTTFKF